MVPVFRDTMDAIRREAKDMSKVVGDDLEKAGEDGGRRAGQAMAKELKKSAGKAGDDAGREYAGHFESMVRDSVKTAEKEIARLDFKTASDNSIKNLERVKRALADLKDVDFNVDFDAKKVLSDIALVRGAVEGLAKGDHEINIVANLQKVLRDLDRVEAEADKVAKKRREMHITADLDTKEAERRVGAFEKKFRSTMKRAADSLGDNVGLELQKIRAELDSLGDIKIGIDMSSEQALAKVAALRAAMEAIVGDGASVDVDVDVAAALAQLTAFEAAREAIDGRDIHIDAKVDGVGRAVAQMTLLDRLMGRAGSNTDNVANSFRSFSFVILAVVTLLPALIPLIGALGGALLALIPILGAVAAGIGIAVLGFSGIGDAVTELGKVADERKVDNGQQEASERSLANALHAVEDAERALADARRNAARANADAQRALADAIRNARRANEDAERAVTDAREQAAEAIEAAWERQKDAADAYADAQDRVREAEQDLRDAREKARDEAASLDEKLRKNAVDERQAVLNLMDAQAQYNAVLADGSATNVDREQASINLENAQIALNDIRDEQVDLNEAQQEYARTGVEGNEDVQSAQEALTEALEAQKDAQEAVTEAAQDARDVQVEAAEAIQEALRNQARTAADGARSIADAQRNVARTAADGARAIADAERALSRAREQRAQAVEAALDEATAAEKRLELAMSKLSPAGRHFARFIFSLRSQFKGLRDSIQEAMFPGIENGLRRIVKTYLPGFKTFATEMAEAVGQLGNQLSKGLDSPSWQRFFKVYAPLMPRLFRQFAKATGNWLTVFADIMTAVAPFAKQFSKALLDLSRRAQKFFESKKGQSAIVEFMEFAKDVGPQVIEFIKQFARAFANIAKALAPLGGGVLGAVTGFLKFIGDMDPDKLGIITVAVLGLVIAFQLAVGAVALLGAGVGIVTTPLALIVFALVAVGTALFILAEKFPWFKNILVTIFDGIRAYISFFVKQWTKFFGMARDYIVKYVIPTVRKIGEILKWVWDKVISPVLGFVADRFRWLGKAVKVVWDSFLFPIIDLFAKLIAKLWEKVISPTLGWIRDKFAWLGEKLGEIWNAHIKPVLDNIWRFIEETVAPKFEAAVNLIKAAWDKLKDAFAEPVRFLIQTVINEGIIGAFNWVADKVGSKPMGTIPLPDWVQENSHAQGTASVLPGYTPGRDVHSFYSPTAGRLNLSGGEAILRPEITKALGGKAAIDHLNNISRRGVGGARAALRGQAFASGGIFWPVPGRRTGTYPGHDGVDINRGSGWDDLNDPIVAAHSGRVSYVGTGKGYGDAIWIAGTDGFTTLYGHTNLQYVHAGQAVQGGQLIGRVGNTGNSSAPHLHFGVYPGGTYAAALAYLAGALPSPETGGGGGFGLPGWVKDILGGPTAWVTDKISGPIGDFKDQFDSPYADLIIKIPEKLAGAVGGAIKDMLPSVPGLGALGTLGEVVGAGADAVGLKDGGILPYNGTMKYDSGGFLPPGLTSVLNLTGKPEPVFTADQFANMGSGDGDGFTYSPTFVGTDLTAADVVDDLDFTRRKIQREGKYGRSR